MGWLVIFPMYRNDTSERSDFADPDFFFRNSDGGSVSTGFYGLEEDIEKHEKQTITFLSNEFFLSPSISK